MQGMAINEDEELKRALREVKLLLPEQDLLESKIVEKSRSD
jgi:hypothetical protein